MTSPPSVSVVVVSRDRAEALARCMTGLTQLAYPLFEIVVVADKPGLLRIDRMPALFDRIKRVRFDSANIGHARNLGIAQAAGQIIAFIDDDAVPEPLWLEHLMGPFQDARVAAAGGHVVGRNGFSTQWGSRSILSTGRCIAIDHTGDTPLILSGAPGMGIKTEGTNMAFRRELLAGLGGFDPAFRFYLDESDLNLRLALAGHGTALVPLARVHHGFLESPRRRADRVPRDLSDVGASLAVFLRKHAPPSDHAGALLLERLDRRNGLLGHMIAGRIEPRDVRRLLGTFDAGVVEGMARKIAKLPRLPAPVAPFLPFRPETRVEVRHRVVAGPARRARRLCREAASLAIGGAVVTAFVLSLSGRAHRAAFMPEGYWLHRGGLFGRSFRGDPPLRLWRFGKRLGREQALLEPVRGRAIPADAPG